MLIDFAPVLAGDASLYDYAQQFSVDDLRQATNESIDAMLEIIGDADDAQVVFIPDDPDADDPGAPPEERYLGWNLAHLVAHVTASSEEWAMYSAILARGIAYGREPRLRYEPDWRTITTRAQVIQQLEESRRMRLAALDMFPDAPHWDALRDMSENFTAKYGRVNAKVAFLFELEHEQGHYAQMREAARQAREALESAGV